jgi:hypothetical protein
MRGIAHAPLVHVLPALASVWLLTAPGSVQGQPGWVPFRSKEAHFSVEMPTEPRATKMTTNSFIGDVTDDLFTSVEGNRRFTVDYSRIPRFALDFAGADTIYDHARGALLKQSWSKPLSFSEVTVDGHAGKRLVYDTPPVPGKPKLYGEAYFVLVGDRLYVADATVPAGQSEADAQRFLGSLRFQ